MYLNMYGIQRYATVCDGILLGMQWYTMEGGRGASTPTRVYIHAGCQKWGNIILLTTLGRGGEPKPLSNMIFKLSRGRRWYILYPYAN
jgi:hypothetical protein